MNNLFACAKRAGGPALRNSVSRFAARRSFVSRGNFRILGIETSCDDTCAAVVDVQAGKKPSILSNIRSSQSEAHAPHGGVVPMIAARLHDERRDPVVDRALSEAGLKISDVSAVAVTVGPGLKPCLRSGIQKAQQLCLDNALPLVCVNHLEGHVLMVRAFEPVPYPFLVLLVSGGHSQLLVCRGPADYVQLGGTVDDSLGEAYDKVARMVGIKGASGGRELELLAREGLPKVNFPIPMRHLRNADFSFSGLKAAVKRSVARHREELGIASGETELPRPVAADIAASFQHAALKHVCERLRFGIQWCKANIPETLGTLVVSGGVAGNQELRRRLDALLSDWDMRLVCPPAEYCTDNAAMIAWAGAELFDRELATLRDADAIRAVRERPRWPLSDRDVAIAADYPVDVALKRRGAHIGKENTRFRDVPTS